MHQSALMVGHAPVTLIAPLVRGSKTAEFLNGAAVLSMHEWFSPTSNVVFFGGGSSMSLSLSPSTN